MIAGNSIVCGGLTAKVKGPRLPALLLKWFNIPGLK